MELQASAAKEDAVPTTDGIDTPDEPFNATSIDFNEAGADEKESVLDARLLDLIREQVASVFIGLAETRAEVHEGLRQLALRDDLINTVHARLAKYEEDFVSRCVIEPLTRRLAAIHRTIARHIATAGSQLSGSSPDSREWCQKTLVALQIELENVLSAFGVEAFTVESDSFDRSCQDVVEKVAGRDTASVGLIAGRRSPGFRIGERVIVREQVAVFGP